MPALKRADPGRCPKCRERVTPFAAGCAICGADLDPGRWDSGPTIAQRAGSLTAALRFGPAAGRPRSGSTPAWVDTCASCVVLGLIASAVAAVMVAILTIAGAI